MPAIPGPLNGASIDLQSQLEVQRSRALAADTDAELSLADDGLLLILNAANPLAQALPEANAQTVGFSVTLLNLGVAVVNVSAGAGTFNGIAAPFVLAAGQSRRFQAVQFFGGGFGYAVVGG